MLIGSHSESHARLTKCNRTELANEISGSKSYLSFADEFLKQENIFESAA